VAVVVSPLCSADTQQKGFFGRSLRKLESLLDKGSSSPLALDPDLASRMSGEQIQLLHLNRALLYYLAGEEMQGVLKSEGRGTSV
jgi:hypothetical protein